MPRPEGGAQPQSTAIEPKAKDAMAERLDALERQVDRVSHLLERTIIVIGQAIRLPTADKERIYRT